MANQLASASSPFDSQTPSNDNSQMPGGSEQTAKNAFDPSAEINQAQDVGESSMAKQFPSASPGLPSQAPSNPNFNSSNVGPEQQTGIYNDFDLVPQIHQDNTNRQRLPTSELSPASPGLASRTHSNTNYKIPRIETTRGWCLCPKSKASQDLTVESNQTANNAFDQIPQLDALCPRFMANQLSSASSLLDSQTPSKDNHRMPSGGSEQTANNVFDPKPETSQDLETVKRLLASNLSSAGPGLAFKTPPNKNNRMQTVGSIQTPNSAFDPIPRINAQDVSQRFMANQLTSAYSRFDPPNSIKRQLQNAIDTANQFKGRNVATYRISHTSRPSASTDTETRTSGVWRTFSSSKYSGKMERGPSSIVLRWCDVTKDLTEYVFQSKWGWECDSFFFKLGPFHNTCDEQLSIGLML